MNFRPFLVLSITFLLAACGGGKSDNSSSAVRSAKGGIKTGQVFRINETEYFRSLYPLNITEVVGHRITNQIYEGLVRLNQSDLTVEPALAKSWEVNDSATVFTFHLRQGVYFHQNECFADGKGREVKAGDFVYCLNKLCAGDDVNNQGFWLVKDLVKGANTYHDITAKKGQVAGVEGIRALNDSTLQIELTRPFASFLYRLAMPFCAVFPQEAFDKYGSGMREKCVGTGPFLLKKLLPDEGVFLTRNEQYWDKDEYGNQLPYLDGVKFSFIKQEKVEMLEFVKGNLDMKYRLPVDMIGDILDASGNLQGEYKKFQLQKVTELSTQYYGYLTTDKVFNNVHVRRAFNYAIDRAKIVDYTVKGEGTPAIYGIVPVGMKGFANTNVKGYTLDVAKAREEMKKAGFAEGKGFPKVTLQINSGGGRNEKVAEAITSMIKDNLGVDVEITQLPFAQHLENLETGKCQFWRLGWNADYPDPENFLNLFYGANVPAKATDKAYINSFRYKNPVYDKLFEKALATANFEERNKIYEQMDQLATDDAVVMPIYYTINRRLLQTSVKNFPANGMEYRLLRDVWIDK